LRAALAELGAEVEESWREGQRVYLRAGAVFARYSLAGLDVPVLEHEARVRALVGETGALRSPAVLAQGTGWLVERNVVPGEAPVEAVVAAAAELATLELPAPAVTPRRRLSLAPLRRRLRWLGRPRLAAELAHARRLLAASRLPEVTTHGDFHPGNVLRADGRAWVVDWELVGRGPAGYDLMRYWAATRDGGERERLYAGALELAGDEAELARLRYALAVLTAADKLSHPQALNRDREGAAELLRLLPELRRAATRGRPRTARAGGRQD
jgi:hypothetical protein